MERGAGAAGLERAIEFHKRHDGAHGGLVRCFVSPSQIDTCTPELLRDAKRFADEVKRPYQVHTSQSVVEFNEMVARYGKTPIAWMKELGVLGSNTILGHAIIIGGSSWTNYPAGDVQLMADAGRRWRTRCGCSPAAASPWSPSGGTGRRASTCRSAPTPIPRA